MPPSTPISGMASIRVARNSSALPLLLSVNSIKRPSCRALRRLFMLVHSEFFNKPCLDHVRQRHIAEQKTDNPDPICSWQRDKTEVMPQGQIRQRDPNRHYHTRGQQQERACHALQEWNLTCADNMNDEGLCQNRLDKPPCMEKAFIVSLHLGS